MYPCAARLRCSNTARETVARRDSVDADPRDELLLLLRRDADDERDDDGRDDDERDDDERDDDDDDG